MSQFVKQEQVRLEIGPQQLALAVADGDLAQLTVAMRAASSMWGGRRFPILAVADSGQVTESGAGPGLLDVLDVTTIIDFSGKLAPTGFVRSEEKRQIPVVPAQPLEDPGQWSPSPLLGHTLEQSKGMRLMEAAAENPVAIAALGRLACREEVDSWATLGAEVRPATDELYYRLSPVMRLTSANGGLPVLAAAAVLEEEGVHLVPGVDASVAGENFEVDLLGWGGTTVLAGEVKRLASGFTDVGRDVRSSARFGADVHVAATLDTVDEDLRTRLEAACTAEGMTLRVLDAGELLTAD